MIVYCEFWRLQFCWSEYVPEVAATNGEACHNSLKINFPDDVQKRTANIGFVITIRTQLRSYWTDFGEIWY